MAKRSSKGFYNWSYFLGLVAILIFLNVIGSLVHMKADMTEDQRYSLAPGTKRFLSEEKNFPNRISVKIYLDGDLPADLQSFRNAIEDKLKDFKDLAGNRIEYQFINPNPENAKEDEKRALHTNLYKQGQGILPMDVVYMKDGTQTQMMLWPGAEIAYSSNGIIKETTIQFLPGTQPGKPMNLDNLNETLENALNNLEYNLLSAIRKITQIEKKRIAFLQGHGELKDGETIRARAILAPYFSLTKVNLNDTLSALDGVDGLIIADPKLPFTNKDLYIIDQFVMKGGKLMVFMNELQFIDDSLMARGVTHTMRKNLKIDNMLFDYGIKIHENLVVDAQCGPKIVPYADQTLVPWFFHILATPSTHPITRNLEPVSLEYANELQLINTTGVKLTKILTTSTNANKTGLAPLISLAMPASYGENPKLAENPKDDVNKITLAAIAEGTFQSHFKNRIVGKFADPKLSGFLSQSKVESKIFVVGNGRFLANEYDSMPDGKGGISFRANPFNELKMNRVLAERRIPLFYGNQEFIQNLVDYMMGDNSVLDIRSRQIDIKEIDMEKVKSQGKTLKYLNLFGPVLLILLFGFVMFLIRKMKYTK